MKTLYCALLAALVATPALAATHSFVWNAALPDGGLVPDANLTGWNDTQIVSGLTGDIIDLDVTLQLSGGWDGDLYAYLSNGDQLVVLLNRPGVTASDPFGYDTSGLSVRFDDDGIADVHTFQMFPDYAALIQDGSAWQPDGRIASPFFVTEASPRTTTLADFNGSSANAPWTLFVADLSGGEVTTVVSWGLNISTQDIQTEEPAAVPETSPALGAILVGIFVAFNRFRNGTPAGPRRGQ